MPEERNAGPLTKRHLHVKLSPVLVKRVFGNLWGSGEVENIYDGFLPVIPPHPA